MRTRSLSVARRAQAAQHAVDVGQRAAGGVGQLAAFGGQRHPARVALEQGHAQPRLELAHVVADRAGGEVQFLRRVGEVLVAGRRFERRQGRQPVRAQGHVEPQIWFVSDSQSMRLCGAAEVIDNRRLARARLSSMAAAAPDAPAGTRSTAMERRLPEVDSGGPHAGVAIDALPAIEVGEGCTRRDLPAGPACACGWSTWRRARNGRCSTTTRPASRYYVISGEVIEGEARHGAGTYVVLRARQPASSAHRNRRAPDRRQPRLRRVPCRWRQSRIDHALLPPDAGLIRASFPLPRPPPRGFRMNSVASASSLPDTHERGWLTPLELGVLGAIWGASFLFMRVAANDFGAMPLVEVRLALGSLVLLPFLWRARAQFPAKLWPKLAIIGAINSAMPFMLFAWAAQRAPAGIGAIANAMTVLFTALVGLPVLRREDRHAARDRAGRRLRRRGGAGQRQDRRRQHRLGGGGRRGGVVPVRHRHQPGAPPPDRPAAGGGGLGDAGRVGAADAAVRDRELADACDPAEVVVLRGACSACCAPAWRSSCTTA